MGQHPSPADLALYASGDSAVSRGLKIRAHLVACRACCEHVDSFRRARSLLKQSISSEHGFGLEGPGLTGVDWPRLEREMSGNIAVGLDAARCIEHVRVRRVPWSILLVLVLLALFAAGWATHIPAVETRRLVAVLHDAFRRGSAIRTANMLQSTPNGIWLHSPGGTLMLKHVAPASVLVSGTDSVDARFVNAETAQVAINVVSTGTSAATPGEPSTGGWLQVQFPSDAPVLPVSVSIGPTTGNVVGMSASLDVRASVSLRNIATKSIEAVSVRMDAAGVKGSGATILPLLNVPPSGVFRLPVALQTTEPLRAAEAKAPHIRLALDGVLFQDGTFYGPDTLQQRLRLQIDEADSNRDWNHDRQLFKDGDIAQLRAELNFGLTDMGPRSANVELTKLLSPPTPEDRPVAVDAIDLPNCPVQVQSGQALVNGGELRAPHVAVRNQSPKTIRFLNVLWILQDDSGFEWAGAETPLRADVGPGQSETVADAAMMRFSGVHLTGVHAFVTAVEFEDGALYIPRSEDVDSARGDAVLKRALLDSPEQEHLRDLYRRKGLAAIAEELSSKH